MIFPIEHIYLLIFIFYSFSQEMKSQIFLKCLYLIEEFVRISLKIPVISNFKLLLSRLIMITDCICLVYMLH